MITLVIFHSKLLHCQIVGQARNQVLVQPGSRQQACLWVGGEATATGPSTSCFRCMWLWVEERYGTFQLDLTWKLEVASRWIAVEFLGLYIYIQYIYIQIYIMPHSGTMKMTGILSFGPRATWIFPSWLCYG